MRTHSACFIRTDTYHFINSLIFSVLHTLGYYCLEGSSTARQYECGNATVYCPRGSFEPRSVHNGFYCDLTGDSKGADRYWGGQDLTVRVHSLMYIENMM